MGEGGTGSSTDDEVWYDDFQTKSQVTTNGSPEVAPSLAVDSNGKAHIAFAGIGGPAPAGDKEIWYAENTTGTWVVTQVSVNLFEDTNPSIWLEASGAIHIAWQGLTDDWDIYYTNDITNPFPNANVLVAAETGDEQEPSLVIDPFGHAHIAYQWTVGAQPDQQIYYTDNMSGTFTSQTGT